MPGVTFTSRVRGGERTTCLTELPDVAPCNGTVRLPGGPCDDSPSSGSSLGPNRGGGGGGGGLKGRREKMSVGEMRRRRCRRLIAPAILLVAAILVGGFCVPLLLQSAPATHQQRLEVIRRLLSEVPLIDGHNDLPWNVRKFVHNQLGDVNLSSDLSRIEPWAKSDWSHTDIPRLRAGQVGAQVKQGELANVSLRGACDRILFCSQPHYCVIFEFYDNSNAVLSIYLV
ncbi:hypothetical protein TKK_0004151 [Trichogramma kaykai]